MYVTPLKLQIKYKWTTKVTVRAVLDFAVAHGYPEFGGPLLGQKKSRRKTSRVYFFHDDFISY